MNLFWLRRKLAPIAVLCAAHFFHNAFAAVELYDFQFVSLRGRTGHEGYFPLQASPVAGTDAIARVRLIGPVQTARVNLVAENGSSLLSFPLQNERPDRPGHPLFLGSVRVPYQPFRVVVDGVETNGAPFTAAQPVPQPPVRPSSLGLELYLATGGLIQPPAVALIYATLTNTGSADVFQIRALDNLGSIITPEVNSISLNALQSASIKITIATQPPTTPVGSYSFTLEARSASVSNVAKLERSISAKAASNLNIDILPGSCVNPLSPEGSSGLTPVVVFGTAAFDVMTVHAGSVTLAGISPQRWVLEDAGAPTSCDRLSKDRINDLVFFFNTRALLDAARAVGQASGRQGRTIVLPFSAKSKLGADLFGFDEVMPR